MCTYLNKYVATPRLRTTTYDVRFRQLSTFVLARLYRIPEFSVSPGNEGIGDLLNLRGREAKYFLLQI